jgi:hypothetical protein
MNLKEIVTSSILSETPEDEALLQKAEYARDQARATTKNIKYDDTAIDIISAVGSIADELSVEEVLKELEYLENAVFQAKNNLESAIYGLEEPFDDLIRTLQNKIDDEEMDRQDQEWEDQQRKEQSEESINETVCKCCNGGKSACSHGKDVCGTCGGTGTVNEGDVIDINRSKKFIKSVLPQKDGAFSNNSKTKKPVVYQIMHYLTLSGKADWTLIYKSPDFDAVKDKLKRLITPVQQGVAPISTDALKVSADSVYIAIPELGITENKILKKFKDKNTFLENFDVVRNTKKVEVTTKSNTNNEHKVAKLLRTVLVNEDSKLDVYELFSLLQSEKPELVEAFKSVALTTYDVQLEEGIKDKLKKGAVAGGVIAALLGINSLMPTAKDGELGQALQTHVQQGGEDSDLAKHYYNALDVYADAGGQRTLINLNIKFNPNFKTNRVSYDPNRQDVEDFLRKQARLPEPKEEDGLEESTTWSPRTSTTPWWSIKP